MIADFLHLFEQVGAKEHRDAPLAELENQIADLAGTHRIELRVGPADPANPRGERSVVISADGETLLSRTGRFEIPGGPGETFEVGRDDGSIVGENYPANAPFPGEVRDVTFSVP